MNKYCRQKETVVSETVTSSIKRWRKLYSDLRSIERIITLQIVLGLYMNEPLRIYHYDLLSQILQGDQKLPVHLTVTVQKTQKIRYFKQNTFGIWTVHYWTRSSRTQFGVTINVWRLAGDTLNITCNFLYCNHQVNRDFLITLYF